MPDPIHRPPRPATWLFERLLSPEYDAVLGDLEEDYHDRADDYGPRRAALRYGLDGLRTAPALFVHNLLWHHIMLKNYLVIAFRNLRKHKGFASINILGLAVSMSVCLLVITLVRDQKSYDTFHEKAERIYRVTSDVDYSFGQYDMATSPGPLGPVLLAESPGVEQVVRMRKFGGHTTVQDRSFLLRGLYAEASLFDVFDFVLEHGNAATALREPFSLVLTQEVALQFFGEANPIGQVIHRDGVGDFVVTGVLKEQPFHKSHLRFEALASFSTISSLEAGTESPGLDDWENASSYYTYVLLAEGTVPEEVAAWCSRLSARHHTDTSLRPATHGLQAITRINLGQELSNQVDRTMPIEAALAFTVLALLMVLTAIFNYVSLSVSRSLKRAREIGIRKVVGAHRGQIVRQFISEAVIVALLALGLAAVLLVWLLPTFNSLAIVQEDMASPVSINLGGDLGLYLLFVGFAVGVGLVAGLYPAFVMSGYLPTVVLKGVSQIKGFAGLTLRKSLIVFQFSLSIIGIIITLVVYQQFSLIMETHYGFDEEQLVNVVLQEVPYETLRHELLQHPGIVSVAAMSCPPVVGCNNNTSIQTGAMEKPALIRYYAVDEETLDQYRLNLVAGRTFSPDFPTDKDDALLLTEAALQMLDLGTPQEAVGTVVSFQGQSVIVIGVVADFFADGAHKGYLPVAFAHWPAEYRFAVVRIRPEGVDETIAHLEATWKTLAPGRVLQYGFYDDQLGAQYLFISEIVKILGFVAGFIIFVSCLGLLGMASYTAETRIKEVGIRKVLGADVRSIVLLLSSDYVKLLAVAVVVAVPLAWLLSDFFLQNFANRMEPGVWVFAVGILPILLLALLTIGSQTIKAGLTNPVETLRHE